MHTRVNGAHVVVHGKPLSGLADLPAILGFRKNIDLELRPLRNRLRGDTLLVTALFASLESCRIRDDGANQH